MIPTLAETSLSAATQITLSADTWLKLVLFLVAQTAALVVFVTRIYHGVDKRLVLLEARQHWERTMEERMLGLERSMRKHGEAAS